MLIHLPIVYTIVFNASIAELSHCDRPYGPKSRKCLLPGPLQKKFVLPCVSPITPTQKKNKRNKKNPHVPTKTTLGI